MNTRPIRLIAIVAAVVGCHSGSEPQQLGSLESRITQGDKQSYVAGGVTPDKVIDLVYRDVLTGSVRFTRPPLWERVLLPPLAYALQAVGVKAQPNSVVCVGEEQTVLIPKVRCVNSDAQGNTRFEFLATTTAGKHQALIQATYGLEETEADTVEITVQPAAANPFYKSQIAPFACSPFALPATIVQDSYGNGVPFRVVSDDTIAVQGDTVGTVAARTIVFDISDTARVTVGNSTSIRYRDLQLRGVGDTLIGYVRYGIFNDSPGYCASQGKPASPVRMDYTSRGLSAAP